MNFFIVMQNDIYDQQMKDKLIQCPQKDSFGNIPHYYSRMIELQKNDRIFHYTNGSIVAIGTVETNTSIREFEQSHYFFVPVDYQILSHPLHIRTHWAEIESRLPVEYAPFQKNGADNTGYLYPCNDFLASSLINNIAVQNSNLELDDINQLTEKRAIANMRIGQNLYKDRLSILWNNECAVCGINVPELLKASHAKPWKDSTNKERLDPYNGLLLCAHHDALFDKGLISFNELGNMLLSHKVLNVIPEIPNISLSSKITLFEENKKYLLWHQSYVFQ
ncbi:HNH endonuclease [Exiguobacterium chiriqhucha]|uniref:HNH nuclease domain-containing protein n=1 Tax=Exiguobacterium chiriqhucha RW-2 TaxID=1345023 RepID=U1M075_9BACL|nr:HNH endonuclease [Exiguobacterium chiriqhucha]ERG68062.1 hypothetical protein M467_12300 [Exiguobacterium chiriqhucha RW-2]